MRFFIYGTSFDNLILMMSDILDDIDELRDLISPGSGHVSCHSGFVTWRASLHFGNFVEPNGEINWDHGYLKVVWSAEWK